MKVHCLPQKFTSCCIAQDRRMLGIKMFISNAVQEITQKNKNGDFAGHVHSPREIISTMCKTGQDALRKRKPCRKLFIHISNKSASNKLKNVSMESSKLNGTSFCSKSCKLKTFPLSIASVLTFVVDGPRL